MPSGESAGEPGLTAGSDVFSNLCNACHPSGQKGLGPALIGVTERLTEGAIVAQVREGGGIMPAFSPEQITDEQLEGVLAYLKTLGGMAVEATATPTAAPVATPSPSATAQATAAADAQSGGQVFAGLCNACHPGGQKGLGPALTGVTKRMTEDEIVGQVREGEGIMPAFSPGQITDEQLADLLAYLATLK